MLMEGVLIWYPLQRRRIQRIEAMVDRQKNRKNGEEVTVEAGARADKAMLQRKGNDCRQHRTDRLVVPKTNPPPSVAATQRRVLVVAISRNVVVVVVVRRKVMAIPQRQIMTAVL